MAREDRVIPRERSINQEKLQKEAVGGIFPS